MMRDKLQNNSALTAVLYGVMGLVLIVMPGITAELLCSFVGGMLMLSGMISIFGFLTHRDMPGQLMTAIILLVAGFLIWRNPSIVAVWIPRLVGALMLFHGIRNVMDAMTLRSSGLPSGGPAMVMGIVTLILGAVLLLNPFSIFKTLVRFLGAFLLYDGVSNLWIALQGR